MTKKKKWSIIATSVSAMVCVMLIALLWWEMTRPERIEIPIPKLTWGMTAAEVEAVLADAGIDGAKVSGIMSQGNGVEYGSLSLSAEEVKKLGVTNVLGLSVASQRWNVVLLRFVNSHTNPSNDEKRMDVLRLVQVELWVEVPEGASWEVNKRVNTALDRAYGKTDIPGYWEIIGNEVKNIKRDGNSYGSYYSPDVHFNQKDCGVGEAVLVYCGAGYVEYLYGGRYGVSGSWR